MPIWKNPGCFLEAAEESLEENGKEVELIRSPEASFSTLVPQTCAKESIEGRKRKQGPDMAGSLQAEFLRHTDCNSPTALSRTCFIALPL